jgi:hypothetical protein
MCGSQSPSNLSTLRLLFLVHSLRYRSRLVQVGRREFLGPVICEQFANIPKKLEERIEEIERQISKFFVQSATARGMENHLDSPSLRL